MMFRFVVSILLIMVSFFPALAQGPLSPADSSRIPAAPLFRDPVLGGPADPTVFWNHEEQNWWMVYTQRRANIRSFNLAWVHGTRIGVASSDDGGVSWLYRGTLPLAVEPGHNTYWAPEVIRHDGAYHLFVSFTRGFPTEDFDDVHQIAYLRGTDLWNLSFVEFADLGSSRVIDPSVIQLEDGSWRMWFKHENAGYVTHYADSPDLRQWTPKGPAIGNVTCEGANVFRWQGGYWMITDPWHGIDIFWSPDAKDWTLQGTILDDKGQRQDDTAPGHHACVVPNGDYAYVFYHVNPEESFGLTSDWATSTYEERWSAIQVARLRLVNGKVVCDRDVPFPLVLPTVPEFGEQKP